MNQNQQLSLIQRIYVLFISLLPLALSILIGKLVKTENQIYYQIALLAITACTVVFMYVNRFKKSQNLNYFYSFLFAFIFLIILGLNWLIAEFVSVDSFRFKLRSVIAIVAIVIFVFVRLFAEKQNTINNKSILENN